MDIKKYFFFTLLSIKKLLKLLGKYILPSNYIISNGIKRPENIILKSSYDIYAEEEVLKSHNYFKKFFSKSLFFDNQDLQREYSIKKALEIDKKKDFYYLEFGVWKGDSINFFSKILDKQLIYGFDSFEGLKEDWLGGYINHPKGRYSLKKKLPRFNKNVRIIEGWVENTLPNYLIEHKPKINFVHMDVDIYESSKFILEKIKPFLVNNAIILFDELFDYPGWEEGEHKALIESFEDNEYKYLAFNKFFNQATIRYLKNV